jgi:Heterokaryon incompatibility protein (HET)
MPIKYLPLNNSRNEIRLLELLPTYYNTTTSKPLLAIRCRLKHVSQDVNPAYSALSYAWGDPNNTVPISVEYFTNIGPDETSLVYVTKNLKIALHHIRDEKKSLNLWVDALCIDQSNNTEKSIQVQRMGNVYENARGVIIWLGPAADKSDLLLEILNETCIDLSKTKLNEEKSVFWEIIHAVNTMDFESSLITNSTREEDSVQVLAQRLLGNVPGRRGIPFQAVVAFMKRAYRTRVWVLQEVLFARDAILVCGFASIESSKFLIGYWLIFSLDMGLRRRLHSLQGLNGQLNGVLEIMSKFKADS